MKKHVFLISGLLVAFASFGQNSTNWPTGSSPAINPNNTTTAGYIGLGTKPSANSTILPSYNLHLHGTADFSITTGIPSGLIPESSSWANVVDLPETGAFVNYGRTTRLGLTNSTTGQTNLDGSVIQMSQSDLYVANQENGNLTLSVPGVFMRLHAASQRINVGGTSVTGNAFARYNVTAGNDNGIYVHSSGQGKYGLSINVRAAADAIQVMDTENLSKKNFKVSGTGEVFARRYTTTLSNIPDYVFADDYELMPLKDLKTFIITNKHLPNIPSAKEYETDGVDLGELNRLLLEKVEELTLYILQMEDRLKVVESAK